MNLRKLGLILACLVLLIGIGTVAHASDVDEGAEPLGKMQTILKSNHFGKDWGFALGMKTWATEWTLPVGMDSTFNYNNKTGEISTTGQQEILQFESDTEVTFIPTFIVRYKNFFIGGSYFPETEYDFESQFHTYGINITNAVVTSDHTTAEYSVSGERKEWDLNLGYFVTPNFAVSLGYKQIDRDYRQAYDFQDSRWTDLKNIVSSESFKAPVLGLAALVPIGKKFSVSANLAYGRIYDSADGNYYLGELGLNYMIPVQKIASAIAINVGYRFQRLDLDFSDEGFVVGDLNDTTSGFIFGLNVSF